MAMPGWKDLLEDIELMITSVDTIAGIETEQQLHFRKGELSIMNWIRTLKQSSADVYEQLLEEEDNAKTDL
jgi:hypothetical protein